MNQQELAESIKQLSNELHALIEESLGHQGSSALQHELIKRKCVTLYDQLLKVEITENIRVSIPPAAKPELPVPEPVIVEKPLPPPSLFNDLPPVHEEITEAPAPIEPKIETPAVTEKTATEIQNEIIDEIIEIREEQKGQQKEPPSKEILSEISLHEKIASVLPKADLTERFTAPLASLKSAINVNLKIAIVNELFNENTVEYVKAIDKLNSSENIHEALRYFTELKHTYNWDNENGLVKELESLVSKRFS